MEKDKSFGVRQIVTFPEKVRKFFYELLERPPKTKAELEMRKREFSRREIIDTILNRDLVSIAQEDDIDLPKNLQTLLQKRAVRTISGVSPIGILTKPFGCPGKCVYCPTEYRMPKSYLSTQPAAARAKRNHFHPYSQVHNRILALEDSGHPTSKLEVIVMGGTWSALPSRYQNWFVKKIFEAGNGEQRATRKEQRIEKIKKAPIWTLQNLQKINETAEHRVIGLTLETRPDWINEKELMRMRRYGCTRIEIGVQTLDDSVQKLTQRGHYRSQVVRATRLMKDFGFKICYHLMPGLPGSTPEKDLQWMNEIFENPDFCPDFVKIYPCMVLPESELYQWWKEGKYKPISTLDLIKLLLLFKKQVPPWARIMRLMRDIPANRVAAGASLSNLRQIMKDQPAKLREIVGEKFWKEHHLQNGVWPCRCVRCREVGFSDPVSRGEIPVLVRRDYDASEGKEVFLSFETRDRKHLFALLRLRKPSEEKAASLELRVKSKGKAGPKISYFKSVLNAHTALIREVHSYGTEVVVGDEQGVGQHRGLGKKLIFKAERIAADEWGMKQMAIIAGIGTREYYRKFGYEEKSTYMVKKLVS